MVKSIANFFMKLLFLMGNSYMFHLTNSMYDNSLHVSMFSHFISFTLELFTLVLLYCTSFIQECKVIDGFLILIFFVMDSFDSCFSNFDFYLNFYPVWSFLYRLNHQNTLRAHTVERDLSPDFYLNHFDCN